MMNTNSKKNGPSSLNQPPQTRSFVGYKLPLVGFRSSVNFAFIGQRKPFIQVNRQSGFTLMELIITLVVAAILVALAVPNMRTFIQNGRLSTQANDFVTDLTYARSEAIKRGTNVGVCVGTSGTGCPVAATNNWELGRLIFADGDNSNSWNGAPSDIALRFRDALGGGNTLRAYTAGGAPLTPSALVFNNQGFLVWGNNIAVAPGSVFTFNLCDIRGTSRGRVMTLNWTGQIRVQLSTTLPASCP